MPYHLSSLYFVVSPKVVTLTSCMELNSATNEKENSRNRQKEMEIKEKKLLINK